MNNVTIIRAIQGMADNTTNLSVLSLNINGLPEDKKRNKLFEKLINKNIDITLLQETHSMTQTINKWKKEYLGKSFSNLGKISKSAGVAIPIKQNLNLEINTIDKNEEGRIFSQFYFRKTSFF